MIKKLLYSFLFLLIGTSLSAQDFFRYLDQDTVYVEEFRRMGNEYFANRDKGKGTGYKQFNRLLYLLELHADEQGRVLPQSHSMAAYDRFMKESADRKNYRTAAAGWIDLGPWNWIRTSGWNPGVGRITCLAVHPTSTNTMYATSPGGGVWRTTNGGTSWTTSTDNLPGLNFFSAVMSPHNVNIVIAGGVNYVYRSTDGGNTWVAATGITGRVIRMIWHPTDANIVLAASTQGIYRSTNGGATWTRPLTGSWEDIEFKPGDPNTVYICGTGGGFRRSTDNGLNFTAITLTGVTVTGRAKIAVTPANANVVYYLQAKGSSFGYLLKSTNSGVSFTIQNEGVSGSGNWFGYNPDGSGTGGQAGHDMALAVHPTNEHDVHIAGIICFRSTNSGTNFTATTVWSLPNATGYNHADVHDLLFNGNTLYSTSDGGVYRSTNNAGDWTDLSPTMGIRQFYRVGLHRANPEIVSGGSQDNGTSARRTDGTWIDWLGADGMESFVHHTNPLIMYGTVQFGGLYRTADGGNTRLGVTKPTTEDGLWVTPFMMDPNNAAMLYVGYNELYRTINNGGAWTQLTTLSVGGSQINNIAIAPSNSNYIYISYNNGRLYRSTNAGGNWTEFTSGTVGTSIRDIEVHPNDPLKIVLLTGTNPGRVYTSTNGGGTWTNYTANLPTVSGGAVAYVANNDGIYVGMNPSVYYRDNTMASWIPYNTNLPNVEISDLQAHVASGQLFAGTYGRGLWKTPLFGSLDISLSSFDAYATTKRTVQVDWQAKVDESSEYFVVERSHNGRNFTSLETFYGKTPGQMRLYHYEDLAPFNGTSYYRLAMHDNKGRTTYSNMIAVNLDLGEMVINVYPNPSDKEFQLLITDPQEDVVEMVITNIKGQIIGTPASINVGNIYIFGEELPKGMYILKLSGKRSAKTVQVVKK